MPNYPRRIFMIGLLLIIFACVFAANEHIYAGIAFAWAGILFGFVAFGLAHSEDG